MANSGLPYPIRASGKELGQIKLSGVPLGVFAGSTYDEATFTLASGDVFVFCTDGVFEATGAHGHHFGLDRTLKVVEEARHGSAQGLVDALFAAVDAFRGDTPPNDDTTVVVVKIS